MILVVFLQFITKSLLIIIKLKAGQLLKIKHILFKYIFEIVILIFMMTDIQELRK